MKPLSKPSELQPADDSGPVAVLSDVEIEERIAAVQGDLRGYIISLAGNGDDCDDILQETNVFLWDRRGEFKPGSHFKGWAFRVAYFKCMASRRDRVRRGEVVFSEDVAQRISAQAGIHFGNRPDRLDALRRCLGKLKADELKLIKVKYQQKLSLTGFASQTGRSIDAIHKSISRIRLGLRSCIEHQLRNEQS